MSERREINKDFDSSDSDDYMQAVDCEYNIVEEEDDTNDLARGISEVNISPNSDTDLETYFHRRRKRMRKLSSSSEDSNSSNSQIRNVIPDPLI